MSKQKKLKTPKIAGDFKKFITRGNILDMAVGVIIGSAFGKIVSSLVGDILMAPINYMLKDSKLANLKWVLQRADEDTGAVEISVKFGNFIQTVLDFMLIAIVIFLVVRTVTHTRTQMIKLRAADIERRRTEEERAALIAEEEARRRAEEAAKNAPPSPTVEELLAQIRDLLAAQSGKGSEGINGGE